MLGRFKMVQKQLDYAQDGEVYVTKKYFYLKEGGTTRLPNSKSCERPRRSFKVKKDWDLKAAKSIPAETSLNRSDFHNEFFCQLCFVARCILEVQKVPPNINWKKNQNGGAEQRARRSLSFEINLFASKNFSKRIKSNQCSRFCPFPDFVHEAQVATVWVDQLRGWGGGGGGDGV